MISLPVRVQYYRRPCTNPKLVNLDVELMAIDLATLCKTEGWTREMFLSSVTKVWDEVAVKVRNPKEGKEYD